MRRNFSFFWVIIFTFAFLICLPQDVRADEDLIIPKWVVNAFLLENGDLDIVEDITFEFDGDFNGVYREIVPVGTSGVSNIQVQELVGNGSKDYTLVEKARNGDSGVYLLEEEKDLIRIKIFSPSEDQQRTFRISYIIKNTAIKYNDIGELYYKFLGDENETPIEIFEVHINLPQPAENDQVKVFAHGPLNGKIRKIDNSTYSLYVEDVPPDTYIEGRILFPKEFIPLSGNVQNIDNYSNILEEEAAYQNKLREDRERRERIRGVLEQASIWASIIGFGVFGLFLKLFRREKNVFQDDGYTGADIPEDCTPAVASYLTGNLVSTNTLFATLLDLIRKGYLKIEEGEDQEEFIITQVKKEDDFLSGHERHFINWLINEMGNGKSVSTDEIQDFCENQRSEYLKLYTDWQSKIREDALRRGYYDKSKTKVGVFVMISSLLFFVLGIFTAIYGSLFGLLSLTAGAVLFVYSIALFSRRSDYGYRQYKKWMAFKKFMKQHQDLSEEDITKLSANASLIYGLSLGIAKKAAECILDKVGSLNDRYSYNNWIVWYLLFVNNDNNAFHKSINGSFSGGPAGSSGGGFSGGGGGGAGGGGAGGF